MIDIIFPPTQYHVKWCKMPRKINLIFIFCVLLSSAKAQTRRPSFQTPPPSFETPPPFFPTTSPSFQTPSPSVQTPSPSFHLAQACGMSFVFHFKFFFIFFFILTLEFKKCFQNFKKTNSLKSNFKNFAASEKNLCQANYFLKHKNLFYKEIIVPGFNVYIKYKLSRFYKKFSRRFYFSQRGLF